MYIYHLCDPLNRIRYVGRSAAPERRFRRHVQSSQTRRTPFAAWMRVLIQRVGMPTLRVVQSCAGDGIEEERAEIQRAWTEGEPVFNVQCLGRHRHPKHEDMWQPLDYAIVGYRYMWRGVRSAAKANAFAQRCNARLGTAIPLPFDIKELWKQERVAAENLLRATTGDNLLPMFENALGNGRGN